jgi:hypothetical protein
VDELSYYTVQAPMTELGALGEVAHSDRLDELARRIQGWVMHPFHAHRYDLAVTPDAERQLQNRSAGQILGEALALDDRPLAEARPPESRTFGNCRHFTTLFTALLRERGIPARSRCGFGTYFGSPKKEDHWVSEVWDAAGSRWRLADAQIDDVQREGMGVTIDTLDVGREDFWVAGQAWLRCRRGEEDPMDFGILDMWGLWFIRSNLIRDLAALCKVELLPWDAWGQMLTPVEALSQGQLALLDRVAELTTATTLDVAEIRALYQKDDSLRVPETIVSYRPEPGPVEIGELARG